MEKINWGIISTAAIGLDSVIPGIIKSKNGVAKGIASRELDRAQSAADKLDIPKIYGSYEEILEDDEIDAIYIPLPNHLHVEYSIKALKAGKHVLSEKPIGLSVQEAQKLKTESEKHPDLKCMEAFMYRHHPQWQKTKHIIQDGGIGELETIQSEFSYFNKDVNDIRNNPDYGGGALMDIGCYSISISRFLYDQEPTKVWGDQEIDPDFKVDSLTQGVLEFKGGKSTFTCGTQLFDHQRVIVLGTQGKIEIEIPFNAPIDQSTRIWYTSEEGTEEIYTKAVDQYTLQVEDFAEAILKSKEQPYSLDDAINNMKTIEAIVQSDAEDQWIELN